MPEPVTIYVPRATPISLDELKQFAGDAEVECDGEGTEWTKAHVKFNDATLTLNFQPEQAFSEFAEHISGFQGYVWNCAGRKMTAPIYALIQRLYLMHSNLGTSSDPEVTPEIERYLGSLAGNVHGLIFRGSSILGPDVSPILSPDGYVEGAVMEYWPDSIERRKKSIEVLSKEGISVPTTKPVASVMEVYEREPTEVAVRAAIVYFTAYAAVPNGIAKSEARKSLEPFKESISPKEEEFLTSEKSEQQDIVNFAWRFEALWVLLWALKLTDTLGPPSQPQQVTVVDELLKAQGGFEGVLEKAELRPYSEILDEADFVMRAHWAVREARRTEKGIPASLNGSVLQERHYAFNWLMSFEWSMWDEVDTPT